MPVICPTVTAYDTHEYREQIEKLNEFAWRIHIDLMDGEFVATKSPPTEQLWWENDLQVDLHIMCKKPLELVEAIIRMRPSLAIMHAEAEGDFQEFAAELKQMGVRSGVALLPETPVSKIAPMLQYANHVLVFAGNLGHQGATANLEMLDKVTEIRRLNPDIEIGWDGGVSDKNARILAIGGVDVLNVGGYIQKSQDPVHAYATLKALLENLDEE